MLSWIILCLVRRCELKIGCIWWWWWFDKWEWVYPGGRFVLESWSLRPEVAGPTCVAPCSLSVFRALRALCSVLTGAVGQPSFSLFGPSVVQQRRPGHQLAWALCVCPSGYPSPFSIQPECSGFSLFSFAQWSYSLKSPSNNPKSTPPKQTILTRIKM